ncbi:MAG: hypothetical protein IJ866_00220 [Alphaproteobacteria bacterium]|nr:hypothetical protein [Alphaproteobacteria bacterium]
MTQYKQVTKYVIDRKININIDPKWKEIYLGVAEPIRYKQEYRVLTYYIPVTDKSDDSFFYIPKVSGARFSTKNAAMKYYNEKQSLKAMQWKINTDEKNNTPFDFMDKQIANFYSFAR